MKLAWAKKALQVLGPGPQRRLPSAPGATCDLLAGWSIEAMPRTAAKINDFGGILPKGTRVYISHIKGTEIGDMVATARRLALEGFAVMPHFPARAIADEAMLADWIARYQGEAGVDQALLLAGGWQTPTGTFDSSMQLLESGRFDRAGFRRLHVAGHPEGSRDIDPDGGDENAMAALRWKQAFSERTDADMAIVTQFVFDPGPVIAWADRLAAENIRLPIHLGVAGPAKLQTLLKYGATCGIGPSMRILQRRARDATRLVLPFEPAEVVERIAAQKAAHPAFGIEAVHLFPLGGIRAAADWMNTYTGTRGAADG